MAARKAPFTSAADPSDPGSAKQLEPGLYVTATPIGNAQDITLRALSILRGCDAILAEDTRVTANLLSIHGIRNRLEPVHAHNEAAAAAAIARRIRAGERLALVSDAGTPLVSDPGARLVQALIAEGLPVTCAPGPSSAVAALVLSGLPAERFMFAGFLPSKAAERRSVLRSLSAVDATLILFEAPHRLAGALADAAQIFGPRPAAVARELTKKFEEVRRGVLPELAARYADEPPRGEIVLVIAPAQPGGAAQEPDLDAALTRALAGASLKEAVAQVAAETGLPRKTVYARALALTKPAR